MECFTTNITIPPLVPDPCDGNIKNTDCVVQVGAIPLLGLAPNSTQTKINSALVLALQNALVRIQQLESNP